MQNGKVFNNQWMICCAALIGLSSAGCVRDHFAAAPRETSIEIVINGDQQAKSRVYQGEIEGDFPDNLVRTLRIMAFDTGGAIRQNDFFNIVNSSMDVIRYPIPTGMYDLVFIANEPGGGTLDGIVSMAGLYGTAFPAEAFDAGLPIPMLQKITQVEIKWSGEAVLNNGTQNIHGAAGKYSPGATTDNLSLELDRLAARVEIVLQSTLDLTGLFEGITLSNVPEEVPLFAAMHPGVGRGYSIDLDPAGNPEYFSDYTPGGGFVWGQRISRLIVPSNNMDGGFTDPADGSKAMILTVHVEGKYHPWCRVRTDEADYTLPYNSWLDITGTVREPLDLNMQLAPWDEHEEEWRIGQIRMLNVSHAAARITDFNGARISFWSNMPSVRVLPEVYVGDTDATVPTNSVFNDLIVTSEGNPTRFYYDRLAGDPDATGWGYMDILADGENQTGTRTYRLVLVAESADNLNQLRREIRVTVSQYGTRFAFEPESGSGYTGAFFRWNETGERIITGEQPEGVEWSATTQDYWIVLSSAPSFDPYAGTDSPETPENYKVIPNEMKYVPDQWDAVSGRGRVYFRVGTTEPASFNRYGTVEVSYGGGLTTTLYVRQGEGADYIFSQADGIEGPVAGSMRNNARRFSPYNLTDTALKGVGAPPEFVAVDGRGVFVDYPTQAGAFFQWGTEDGNYVRRAYRPVGTVQAANWNGGDNSYFWTSLPLENETCPSGYLRPDDGSRFARSFNGYYDPPAGAPAGSDVPVDDPTQILASGFRMSLFRSPEAGNGYSETGVSPTFPASLISGGAAPGYVSQLPETAGGFYADGFFDRRPVDAATKGVSLGNGNTAFAGTLFFDEASARSLFFPSVGRRAALTGALERQGMEGYYWSTSVAGWFPGVAYPAWYFMLSYDRTAPVSDLKSYGMSIRCVEQNQD